METMLFDREFLSNRTNMVLSVNIPMKQSAAPRYRLITSKLRIN